MATPAHTICHPCAHAQHQMCTGHAQRWDGPPWRTVLVDCQCSCEQQNRLW